MRNKILVSMVILLFACNPSDIINPSSNSDGNTSSDISNLPLGFRKFLDTYTDVYISGDYVVIETEGIPNHQSPYWGSNHSNYTSPHSGMAINPNIISAQNFKFYIPINPTVSNVISSTSLGPIGVSINGVPFFNQYGGPNNQPLSNEIASFDVYNGHPQQTGQYHYHWEPLYLTSTDSSVLIGYSMDGFPIYGPTNQTDGNYPTDLDNINGHTHVTDEYPDGIYHYHATSTVPYLVGGYKGVVGSASGGGYYTN
tara:strand:+ start:934 stop:1698 length:765 start_codon:yes stop_codon:yes gene_type:complete